MWRIKYRNTDLTRQIDKIDWRGRLIMYRGFGHHGLLQLVLWHHLQRDLQHLGVVGLRGLPGPELANWLTQQGLSRPWWLVPVMVARMSQKAARSTSWARHTSVLLPLKVRWTQSGWLSTSMTDGGGAMLRLGQDRPHTRAADRSSAAGRPAGVSGKQQTS